MSICLTYKRKESSECDYGLHVVIFVLIVSAKEAVPSPRKPDLSGIPEGTSEASLKNLSVGRKKKEGRVPL